MLEYLPDKYKLFVFFCAFLIGCLLRAANYLNVYTFLPILILAAMTAAINRKNRAALLFPMLIVVLLLGGFEYHQAASKQSSLERFIGRTAVVEGIAAAEPVETQFGYKLILKKVYCIENGKRFKCNENLQVFISSGNRLQFGDHIRMTAVVEPAAKLRNFGDFSFERYFASKSIYMKVYPKEMTKLASNKGGLVSTILYKCNQKVKDAIFKAMPKTEAALLYGILTGSKSEIDEDMLEVFSLTGLAHILSVSGLHIGFLVLMLSFVLKPLKLEKKLQGIIIFAIVLFYILIIGAPVPAVRALIMLAVLLGGDILGKKYDLNASASFAAFALLLWNPLLIHDPSYTISFACIYSISFLHQPLSKIMSFLPTWLRSSLALSLAVWIGITPVLIYYFNYVSIINIFLNVLAVPLSFVITIAGFAAVVIGIAFPSAAIFIFAVSYYLIRLLYFFSEGALLLPYSGFNIPSVRAYVNILYYAFALMLLEDFWYGRSLKFKRFYTAGCIIGFCLITALTIIPGTTLRINFLDVGQGDCSVIRTPNHKTIIVDGGGSSDWEKTSYDIGEKVTVPALLRLGVWKADAVIVSHIHDDHMGGVISILETFTVGQVLLPASDRYGKGEFSSGNYEKLIKLCHDRNIPISYIESGSSLAVGDIKLKVLSPKKPYIQNTDSDINNNSLVFKLSYEEFDALFTGDIQQEAEMRLLDDNIDCDVIKVAHHGSPFSSVDEFVRKADPEISIISVGRNNYGHPSKDVINRLIGAGSLVYRTDERGAVMLQTSGSEIKLTSVR